MIMLRRFNITFDFNDFCKNPFVREEKKNVVLDGRAVHFVAINSRLLHKPKKLKRPHFKEELRSGPLLPLPPPVAGVIDELTYYSQTSLLHFLRAIFLLRNEDFARMRFY